MRTEKQIAASRANGAKSMGPRSPRRQSKRQLIPLHATLGDAVVHDDESVAAFRSLEKVLHAAMQPRNPLEYLFVGRIAAAHWQQIRYWKAAKLQARETLLGRQDYQQEPQPRTLPFMAAQRSGNDFFRAVLWFYRLRKLAAQPSNPAEPDNWLKTLEEMEQMEPDENPGETQPEARDLDLAEIEPAQAGPDSAPTALAPVAPTPTVPAQTKGRKARRAARNARKNTQRQSRNRTASPPMQTVNITPQEPPERVTLPEGPARERENQP